MLRWLLHGLLAGFGSLPVSALCPAQTPPVWPDGPGIEVAVAASGLDGDADHAEVGLAANGDFVVVFRVESPGSQQVEIHACYFSLVRDGGAHWEAGPSVVLGAVDRDGRSCSRADVVATHDSGSPDEPLFLVVWGRHDRGDFTGALEGAALAPPPAPGAPPRVVHSDGVSGVALDDNLDAHGGRVRPQLVWHPALGRGHAAVVYNHRVAATAHEVTMAVRWREFALGAQPHEVQILAADVLVPRVRFFGALLQRPGGYLPVDAVLMNRAAAGNGLRLVVAHEESLHLLGNDLSRIRLRSFVFDTGRTPLADELLDILPGPTLNDRYPRRPKLAWNRAPGNHRTVQLTWFTVGPGAVFHYAAHAARLHFDARGLQPLEWQAGVPRSSHPVPFATSRRHGVVYNDEATLRFALDGGPGLIDAPSPIGSGVVAALAWREGAGPAGSTVCAIAGHAQSMHGSGSVLRPQVWVRLLP